VFIARVIHAADVDGQHVLLGLYARGARGFVHALDGIGNGAAKRRRGAADRNQYQRGEPLLHFWRCNRLAHFVFQPCDDGGWCFRRLREDLAAVHAGLESALSDLRAVCAGLRLPEIAELSTYDVAARAVRDYEGKTGAKVKLDTMGDPVQAALPVKITLYRLLQESLAILA
jgi:hypothetical protein